MAEVGEQDGERNIQVVTVVYREVLLEVLDPNDVLTYMSQMFTGPEKANIEALQQRCFDYGTPRLDLVQEFLDMLEKVEDKRGIFQAFMEALNRSDNEYLRHHLEGTSNLNSKRRDNYQYLMKIYLEKLKDMSTMDVMKHLEGSCLNSNDIERIRRKNENYGPIAACTELMLRLQRKDEDFFDRLVKGLDESGSKDLAHELRHMKNFALGIEDADSDQADEEIPMETNETEEMGDQETMDVNTAVNEGPQELILRPYQEKVAAQSLRGENSLCSLVVLPTGKGKTEVAIAVIQRLFLHSSDSELGASSSHGNKKTVFVVNKVPLVTQQKERCLKYLRGKCRVAGVSGEEIAGAPLDTVINSNDIIVLTAQILVNALKDSTSRVSLSRIDLLVLDECHHCQKSNPYNVLMALYRDLKLNQPTAQRPQILGLTASPGVGNAKNLKEAEEHIIKLCANLDATIPQETNEVTFDDQDEGPHEIQRIVQGRSDRDPFFRRISGIMADIENRIAESETGSRLLTEDSTSSTARPKRGKQHYENWVVAFRRQITLQVNNSEERLKLLTCVEYLREYNNCLFINRDVRTTDAIDYMEKFVASPEREIATGITDVILAKQFRDVLPDLRQSSELDLSSNPVLAELGKRLKHEYRVEPESLTIIFTKTRQSAIALVKWLNEEPFLQQFKADLLIGSGDQGMTSNAQTQLLRMFSEGEKKIIVCTSVAEEGLDIQKCNVVVRYNYVTSDVGHVQTRGRSRAFNGKSYLVVNAELQLEYRELRNIMRVEMMKDSVQTLSKMDRKLLARRIREEQRKDQKERSVKKKSLEEKTARRVEMSVMFYCESCLTLACTSDDIRTFRNTHHVVFNNRFLQYIQRKDCEKVKIFDEMEHRQKIFCGKCQKKLGTMVVYGGHELPLIAVENFTLKDQQGRQLPHIDQWSKVPFMIRELDLSDLGEQVNNLSAPNDDDAGNQSDDDNQLTYFNIREDEDD
ncbi:ATP-dependent RNA helicase DHX58-like [Diadema antillarum]|uniref:ATP-dependent RNA helicase DHX58-like n=1 Tax=Diadema antillarum TaxID=105358 RepID=UPI003A84AFA6